MNGTSDKPPKNNIKEILSKYREAGKISIEAKKLALKICKPGARAYDVCEKIEDLIIKKGAKPAFPVNISINHEAAHYSATILDNRIVPENAIVKIDLGAHIDGYLVDTAITVNHDPELEELYNASKDALEKAIDTVKPGLKVDEVGKVIEKTIEGYGFQPIRNLSGHQIKKYILHAGVSIPNAGPNAFGRSAAKFEPGRIYAIEPFASTGKGWVNNDRVVNIYRYVKDPRSKDKDLHKIAMTVKNTVGPLPFSPRHLYDKTTGNKGKEEVTRVIRKLLRANVIMGYPVLIEENKNIRVSQHEDTIRITRDGCEVLTKS